MIEQRDNPYKRWKQFKTPLLHNQFRALRIQVNKVIQQEKASYFETRFRSALSSKKKWDTIREIGIGSRTKAVTNIDPDETNKLSTSNVLSILEHAASTFLITTNRRQNVNIEINVKIGDQDIERVDNSKNLGIIFNDTLS